MKKVIIVISFISVLPILTSCGLDSKSASTSQDNTSKKSYSYKSPKGRMDYVEYNINKELAANGLDLESNVSGSDNSEIYSYHVEDGKWSPNKKNSIPIVYNANVERWIKSFNGPLRSNFSRWLGRLSYYGPIMEGIFRQYHLPPDLVYLGMIESGFNLNAYSTAAASGPWQFIKSTGSMYGLQSGSFVDERRDLIKATHAAAQHLGDLHKIYGDWYLAFAAYNAGGGKVNSAIRKGGTRDYWKLASPKSKLLRQETKDYVPKILAAAIISKNYRKYGYSSDLFRAPLDIEVAKVPDATDVYVLAKCAGVSVDEIRNLNPSLLAGVTPPGAKYDVVLPEGTGETFNENYCKVPRAGRANFVFHRVVGHENIYTIASKYKVSAQKIAEINKIAPKAKLSPGRIVMVPKEGKGLEKLMAETKSDYIERNTAAVTPLVADARDKKRKAKDKKQNELEDLVASQMAEEKQAKVEPIVVAEEKEALPEGAAIVVLPSEAPSDIDPALLALTYRVQEGDTLASIAQKFDITADNLATWNALPKGALLVGGRTIFIAEPRGDTRIQLAQDTSVTLPPSPVFTKYKVKAGDTLSSVARKNGVWQKDIQEWNKMGKSQVVRIGQILKIGNSQVPVSNTDIASLSAPLGTRKVAVNKPIIHRVLRGETLWDLAKKYKVSVNDLKSWNSLRSNQLYPNQKIKIIAMARKSSKVAMAY